MHINFIGGDVMPLFKKKIKKKEPVKVYVDPTPELKRKFDLPDSLEKVKEVINLEVKIINAKQERNI